MQGLELSRLFYRDVVSPMIDADFPAFRDRIATGLVGRGSECFLFDDEISRDHDFGPDICIWITKETDDEIGFKLMRAYLALSKEFMGYVKKRRNSYGERRTGLFRIPDFYEMLIGIKGIPENYEQWLRIPEYAFAEATNGAVFSDTEGEFSYIRNGILKMDEDVRKKKIAARLALMAQSGQYNYPRCLAHGETEAAKWALHNFIEHAVYLLFALNHRFTPYYKWWFRSLKANTIIPEGEGILSALLLGEKDPEPLIDTLSKLVIKELATQGLSDSSDPYLEAQAFAVQKGIIRKEVRALHIMDC